jgi:hypothetical protein
MSVPSLSDGYKEKRRKKKLPNSRDGIYIYIDKLIRGFMSISMNDLYKKNYIGATACKI